ncbi:AbiH family protein [Flavobacterium sp. RHBU_24]|uniref:AbiH family protein n=1 Tax=Flavobacterium sp. RHBU_24 TaxID=3391185 RepID=UPI003984BDC1
MNRLIIVGNGFDLAHGLPTGYGHFIDWYWKDLVSQVELFQYPHWKTHYDHEDLEIHFEFKIDPHFSSNSVIFVYEKLNQINSLKAFRNFVRQLEIENDVQEYTYGNWDVSFKNNFIQVINERHSIQNWVDIENEYYKLLKDCLNEKNNIKVKKLNEEFERVKQLLKRYLNEEVVSKFDFEKSNDKADEFIKHFIVRPRIFEGNSYLEEFPNTDFEYLKKEDEEIKKAFKDGTLQQKIWNGKISEVNLFLNFNYTFSMDKYKRFMNRNNLRDVFGQPELIQIHGRLNDPNNKINFGFGDEMDNHYQKIEEKDDNEYLKYIKSFQYSQNSNYKRVLDFIDSGKFQVYIMGHSCGLSDRILLNTIFENENCRSIKVFYHQKDDGTDNYTEIVQNISRHFNKKKMMRDKIVNKSLCQPLPQDIRFEAIGVRP